jgi:hypothetical protein
LPDAWPTDESKVYQRYRPCSTNRRELFGNRASTAKVSDGKSQYLSILIWPLGGLAGFEATSVHPDKPAATESIADARALRPDKRAAQARHRGNAATRGD